MFKTLLATTGLLAALVSPSYALTIAEGQQQHADAKAAGYSFVTTGNVSIGTLKVTGNDAHTTGTSSSADQPPLNTDGICGIFDDTVMVGGKPFCIWNNQTTHDANHDHGHAIGTGGPFCNVNTVTFTADPAHNSVMRSDSSKAC